jgi:ribonuclease-3
VEVTNALGYEFKNPLLLEHALTHKSFKNEQPTLATEDNERLEFLGDAVLDLALSQLLMEQYPQDQEGPLSKKRASLVNEEALAELARQTGLDTGLRLGKGERQTGGVQKPRLLASSLEAVLGAVFLDGGYPASCDVVRHLFARLIQGFAEGENPFARDFKTRLQELVQEKHKVTPTYHLEREEGPDHEKTFIVSVRMNEQHLAEGNGRSKKAAEQDAARAALEKMESPT